MSKKEYLKIFNSGIEAWNNWRESNPDIKIDFSDIQFEDNDFSIMRSGINIDEAQEEIKISNKYKIFPNNLNKLIKKHYDRKYLGNGVNLSFINFKGARFNNVDFTGADLTGSNLEGAVIEKSKFIYAKINSAKLTAASFLNTAISHSTFIASNLNQARFTNSGLEEVNFTNSNITFTTKFYDCNVDDMIIDKSRLEVMDNYGGLSTGHRMKMQIVDGVATLRAAYSGFQQWIHIFALMAFIFPYMWFVLKLWIKARFITIDSNTTITIAEALARYIFNGGMNWQNGFIFHWTFLTFLWMLMYNVLRGVLLWKTKTLELQQKISGLPLQFTLHESNWGLALKIINWSFLITLVLVVLNIGHFLMMKIPIT